MYVRACVRACMHACMHACMYVCECLCVFACDVAYVTTTSHKYHSLNNVTIGFLFFFYFRQCHVRVFVPQIVIVITLQQGSSLCKYYYVSTRNKSPAFISYSKS